MIGGTDVCIPTRGGITFDAAMDACIRVIRRFWPEAVFEIASVGEVVERYEKLALSGVEEVLVYKNGQAARDWEQKGADPSLLGSMIQLIASNELMTVIVDDAKEDAMASLLEAIRSVLRMDFLNVTAKGKQAA